MDDHTKLATLRARLAACWARFEADLARQREAERQALFATLREQNARMAELAEELAALRRELFPGRGGDACGSG